MFNPNPERRQANVILAGEQAVEVMDSQSDEGRKALYQLDYETWLPFAAKTYQISPDINDYVIVCVPICPAEIPNRNGIGFPTSELVEFRPPPVSRQAYKAWAGCPAHYEHKNEVHEDAYGVILDASFHKVSGYGKGKLWKVMGLVGVDKTKYAKMAQRVLDGDINTWSMGAYVDSFSCSYCKKPMTKSQFCNHLHPSNDVDWAEHQDYDGTRHLAFRNAHGINPIEISLVESPAWTTALSDHILTR